MTLLVLNINWGCKDNNLINDISHHDFLLNLAKLSAPHLLLSYIEAQQQVKLLVITTRICMPINFCHVSFTHIMTTNNQNKDPYTLITNYLKWTWPWDIQGSSYKQCSSDDGDCANLVLILLSYSHTYFLHNC